ncbi:Lsr2 family protein [Pseudokineococcus marinus]|uniref:Lsr2 family protein n=1 Tax=Pseudokineococcus marinus TaxID=351215 RepID=A0A849BYH7_9ACTN|nr:Lsr2 family protein [Pseudokineococcus marinus]NNH24466.1 Lsr2 family protein [Pseudokineococcus marinus]
MAQKTKVILIDDVEGGEADETVTFALDGVSYEIDLTSERAAQLRDALAPWVGHARKAGGRSSGGGARRSTRSSGSSSSSAGGVDTAAVREWARENGHTVSERGRISGAVLEAYKAAQG